MRFILLIQIITFSCYAQDYENDFFSKTTLLAKEKVKTVTVSRLKNDSTWYDSQSYSFDSIGNRTKERTFILNYSTTWVYDSHNIFIEKIDSSSKQIKGEYKVLNDYNSKNQLTKQVRYFNIDNTRNCRHFIETSDILKNSDLCVFEVIELHYNTDSTIKNKTTRYYLFEALDTAIITYEYDLNKNITKKCERNKCIEYTYNRHNQIKRIDNYSSQGRLAEYSKLQYNSNGLLIKRTNYEFGTKNNIEVYTYYKNNLLESSINTRHIKFYLKRPYRLRHVKGRVIHRKYYYTFY